MSVAFCYSYHIIHFQLKDVFTIPLSDCGWQGVEEKQWGKNPRTDLEIKQAKHSQPATEEM